MFGLGDLFTVLNSCLRSDLNRAGFFECLEGRSFAGGRWKGRRLRLGSEPLGSDPDLDISGY